METFRTRSGATLHGEGRWRALAVQTLVLLVAVNGALAFYAFRQVEMLKSQIDESLWRSEQRFHSLQSQVHFDSERRRLLLGIRNAILETRPEVGLAQAYEFAEMVLAASEKYPSVDPLLLVSVGIVESHYDSRAVSHAGARGLYQIYPSTGRLLARMLGWEFDEKLLHDPATNTEMAAVYLDLLGTAYNDVEMILAEYNGGPLNAGYFRAKVGRLSLETRDYVPRVLRVYERLRRDLNNNVPEIPAKTTKLLGTPSAAKTVASAAVSASASAANGGEE
jgi:soluble lytic murein transglycosylase-like protein